MRARISYLLILSCNAALVLASGTCLAAPKGNGVFPKGCRSQGYSFAQNEVNLTPTNEGQDSQSLFLINNKTGQSVTLYAHEKQYELLGMDWTLTLEPKSWSSFAINKPHLAFVCRNEAGSAIDCETALNLCEYNRAVFGDALYGTYWGVTNKPQSEVVASTIKNGILLRW